MALPSNNVPVTNLPARRYAGISCVDSAAALSLPTQNQWEQVVSFDTNGPSNGATPDHTQDHITVARTIAHAIEFGASYKGTVSSDYEIGVFKNNGATRLDPVLIKRTIGAGAGANDFGDVSRRFTVALTAGDTIEVWARCTTGNTKSITLVHCTLLVEELNP